MRTKRFAAGDGFARERPSLRTARAWRTHEGVTSARVEGERARFDLWERIVVVRRLALLGCFLFLAGCGGAGGIGTPATSWRQNDVSGAIAPALHQCGAFGCPGGGSPATPAPRGRPVFVNVGVPQNAESIVVSASATGQSTATTTVNCSGECRAAMTLAPSIAWLFSVTLYGGPDGTGSVLSQGSIAQTVLPLASNQVKITFNPVVASVTLALSASALVGAGSETLTVTPLDATGASIVGPKPYELADGSPAPLALVFADASSGAQSDFSTPAPFMSPPPAGATLAGTIAYNGDSIGLQFPILAISQDGSSIPVNRPAQQLAALPSIGAPEGGAWLSHFAITYDAGPSPHPYICYNDNTNDGAPTIADVFGDDFGVVPTTPNGPASCGLSALGSDGSFWWFDYFAGVFGRATLNPVTVSAYPVAGCAPSGITYVPLLTLGSDGNLWFAASEGQGGSTVPQFGHLSTSGAGGCSPISIGSAGDEISAIVGGPAGATYFTLRSNARGTTQLYSVTAGASAPSAVGGALPFNVTAIGYASDDGNLYAQSTSSAIYTIVPGTAASKVLCADAPFLTDLHHQFAQLQDGTLAYMDDGGDVTRIAPGVGCATIPGVLTADYYLFAIAPDGSSLINSNGGNIAHAVI